MKQRNGIFAILTAAALAVSPPAFAADTTGVVGGLLIAAVGGGYYAIERSDAQDEADACAARRAAASSTGIGSCEEEVSTGGVVGLIFGIGGLVWAGSSLFDGSGAYNFTRNGIVMDGMTLGYTDTGKVGLQKKWEF